MFTNVIKKIKEMSFVGKQPAFTLAEVLITLVVLGVIASTVTGVVYFSRKDMNNKDLVATLQSQVIKLNRSYKIALAENDDLDRWVYKNSSDNSVEKMSTATQAKKNELFAKVWESYFPSTKVCGASTSDTCFPKSTVSGQSSVNYNSKSDYYKLRTGDGAAVAIKISDHLCRGTGVNGKDKGVCGEIIIDINGNKGPNKEGLDTYRLGIYHNGIRPFAAGCDNPLNSANVVLTSGETCYEDFNVITCPKDSPHKCHNCDGKIVCVANETACSALQKSGGCAQETCPAGTISYYADGKIQCIPEDQKNCYEQIKLNPEYKWDPVTKKCLTPKENCEKNGGYWEDGKEICWDSPEHMCTTKQQVYIPKPNQNPNFECISQEEYCKREVRKDGTGGLGGWLWKNNVCCTATSVASNTNATCCNSYSDIKGGSHTWWDGTSACCTSNNTEACCKSVEDGHEAGFWSNGKCWKDPKTQCENSAPTGLGGIWIASTNSCCTTKIVDNKDNPKYCFASEKDKCNAPSDKGGKGGWYVASADKCCTSETDAQVCCKGIWRTYNGKNYCYENEKAVCVAPTNQAGIGGWWVPEATTGYNTYSGCCTSSNTRACCNGIDKDHWWAASGTSCCAGPIEASKACCESAENGHESKYWTSTPSQCWTSASQFCITPTGSNGLGGWNWIGDAKSGVCCTDTSKTTRSNDNGNGNIQHQGQFDRLLTDDYSKRCCINESTLNGHSRFIWYTANYKGNTGYCWDNVNNLCQQQTDSSDDHGLGGWYWDGTDCCSINTQPASISYWTKGNIKANPPTLESTANVSVKNESDRSTKSCCTNTNSKGNHTRFNWTDKNYAGKGGYCWFDDEELCQNQTDSGNDFGMGGWYWDKASSHCCSSKYDVNVNTNNKTQEVFRKGATSAQVKVYNQQNDSNLNCCTNSNTKGGHTRFIWTAKAYADTRGYCWLNNDELCQEQTDNSNYNHDAGMGGWLWDSASNSCCTINTTSAQPINVKGGSASSVAVKNQSSNSNKNCCTNPNKKGGHTRFNWTDKTYSNKGGYCWFDDEELCQAQTGLADYGMGGWYWDKDTSTCCTIKYDTSITTAPKTQEVFRSGGFSAQVKVFNQQNASNKACCTNNNSKGGHTRYNWTDKNHAGNGGYCWLDDEELCQAQTDAAGTYGKDYGMSGWAWDSSSNRCCTNKYNTNIKAENSTQTKYVKGGASATVKAYNQQNDSNKFCCTNSNTKGGHTRFNWTDNNYASSGGYCWNNDDELCQTQTDASGTYGKDYGMGGWLWDSASNSCCTIKTTSAQTKYVKGGSSASVAVKNQSSNSNKNCCTNSNSKGGHTRYNWTDKTYSNKGGYCWLDDEELCQAQTGLADYGMGGWYWDKDTSTCCTIKYDTSITTAPKTQEVFRKGASSAQVKVFNQQNASNKACCTNNNSKGGHTRYNWTDKNHAGNGGYCWLDDEELCQAQTDAAGTYGKDYGMSGWAWDSSSNRCCTNKYNTNIKAENSTQTKYVKGGASATVKAYNQQNDSNKFCCTNSNTKGGHTRFNWTDNNYASSGGYCWNNDEELCQAQTDASGTYGKDYGMGGWLWDSASNSCCTIKTTSAQTKYVKGGSSASVAVKNQSSNSNKNCCTNPSTKGGHTRFIWTDKTYSNKGGYCWLNNEELCKAQTGLADYGMGGWYWDSASSTCCTVKYDTSITTKPNSQQVYTSGGFASNVNVTNQQNASNKACCTSSNTAGGHTRFNWTDNNYASSGGYCWLDDAELCQAQTDAASTYGKDYGMGGWYWDSASSTCCTIKTTTAQKKYTKGGTAANVAIKNESNASNKACCTNNNTKGGHTRFNWTDNNYASSGGYCWKDDEELCQSQTGQTNDFGMGGWAWDSSASTCCTIKTTSAQTKYVKGGSSSKVNIKNQSSTSSKFCCTNSNSKGGHDRFIWTDNNYASKGGYCWKDNAEVCENQTGLADYGMGGWLWDSTNSVCCTVKTTSAQKIYTKGGTQSSIAVKNQSNDSTRQCCTSTATKGGHKNTLWSSTTSKDNSGYCWLDKAEFCKATISAGLKGWDYDATNGQCCTDNTTTDSSYWNGSKYTKLGKKDQAGSSSEYCCTSTSTSGGHVNFNWINGKCWNSNSGFCTDTTANKGAGGWYQDGSNCCTTSKTGTETVKGKGGTTSTITYKNNTDNSTAECCRKRGDNTRAYWLNTYCWNTLNEYCTSTGKGASGYYSYTSGSTNYCCTGAKTGSLSGKNDGNDYKITYKGHVAGEETTKECCVNAKSGAKTYINSRCWSDLDNYCTTSSSSGGAGGYYQYDDVCCVAGKTATSVSVAGGSSATATSTLDIKNENSTKTCCHNKSGTNWYSTSSETSGTCCSQENSKACCESTQNGHTAGVWSASTNTCCHNDNVSEACCQAYKDSTSAFLAGGKCCASENDSATCCKGYCNNGDAYTYNSTTKQCSCVSCDSDEYIPKDSSDNVLAAKCCSSINDDSTCCTAANAPGNTAGNFYYATSMCCASENDSAECCSAKYPTKKTAYYNSKCYNFTASKWLLCAQYDTSKISTVSVNGSVNLVNKECTEVSADALVKSKTVSPNKFGSATVTGSGCTYTADTADDVYSSKGTVSFEAGSSGNYMCLYAPSTGSCSGWWESETSTDCCTSENRSACCESTLNPDGAGTWASSTNTCCHSAIASDTCCKAMNSSSYYLAGSTCCASENTSSTCCTSTSNPNGKGKWSSSAKTCCHSETASDACCKAINGSAYSLYGGTCATEDPNACKGWETSDGTCCSQENTKDCCIADTNPDGAGWWVKNSTTTAYVYDPNIELIAINIPNAYRYKGRVLNYTPVPLFAQPAYAALQNNILVDDSTIGGGSSGGGSSGGSSGSSSSSSSSVSFKFSISDSTGYDSFVMEDSAISGSTTTLNKTLKNGVDYAATLRCDSGYIAALKLATGSSGCTLTIDADGAQFVDATVTTKSAGKTCNVTGTCTKSSTSGSGSGSGTGGSTDSGSDSGSSGSTDSGSGSGTGGSSDTGAGSYTCCHDEQVSDACCLGKTDKNYWYNNSCSTVKSGVDIIVEYGSDISSVKVGGTSVSNKGKKNVSSANGTTIVATPASGKTFSKWTSTNCTITSSTSGSTTISGVSSGAKYCIIKPTAIEDETQEFTVSLVQPTSSAASAGYNIVLYNSSNEEVLNLNNGTLSASSLPAGDYKLRIGTFSYGTGAGSKVINTNLSASVTGNCTLGSKSTDSTSSSDIGSKWTLTLPESGDTSCNISVSVGDSSSSGCTGQYNLTVKTPDKYTYIPWTYTGTSQETLYAKYSASSVLIDTVNEIYQGTRENIHCTAESTNIELTYNYSDTSNSAQHYLEITGPCEFTGFGSSFTKYVGQIKATSSSGDDITCTFTPKNCGSVCSWISSNGKKCCASENTKECCEGPSRVITAYSCTHQKGTWDSTGSKCCHTPSESYTCCQAYYGSNAVWQNGTCTNSSSGGGTTTNKTYGVVVTGMSNVKSVNVNGTLVSSVGTSLDVTSSNSKITITANVKDGYNFEKWEASQGCHFANGSSTESPTTLTFSSVNDQSSTTYQPCILKAYATEGCDGWLAGSDCCTVENTSACCSADTNPDGAGTWASSSNTCCHDKSASEDCCTAMSSNNYWYNNVCTTVESGVDIIVEYGSDISSVKVGGTSVSNKGKKNVTSPSGTAIVATPASGMAFSQWTAANCILASTTSESTTISSVYSGAKYCIIKPEAVEAETPEFTGTNATIRLSSTAEDVEYSLANSYDSYRRELSTSPILLQHKAQTGYTNPDDPPYLYVIYDEGNPPTDITIESGDCSLDCASPVDANSAIGSLYLCCADELLSPYQTSEICGYNTSANGVVRNDSSGNLAFLDGKTCMSSNTYPNKKMVKCLINFEDNAKCVVSTGTSCSSAIFDTNGNCCTTPNSSEACCQGMLGADSNYYDVTTVNGDKGFCLPPYLNGEILGKVTLNVTSTDNSLHGATVYLQDSIGGGEVTATEVGTFYVEDVEVPTYYTDPLYFAFSKGSNFGTATYTISTSGSCSMYEDPDFSTEDDMIAHLYMTGTSSSTNTCTVNVRVSSASSVCTYDGTSATFKKGTMSTNSGAIVSVTVNGSNLNSGQKYSGNGTLVFTSNLGAEGTFTPRFKGDCCSLSSCSVTGSGIVSCQAKWGSGTCTVSVEDCDNGFPAGGGNGECCLDDNQSQACCESDSVDSSTGFASHNKGLWDGATCGVPEAVYVSLNSCISNGTGASEVRITNLSGTEEINSVYTETCGENGTGMDTGSYIIKPILSGADMGKLAGSYFYTSGSCNIKGSSKVKASDCNNGCNLEVSGTCTIWVADSSSFSTCSACGASSENEWSNGQITVQASNSPTGLSDSTIYVYDSDGAEVLKTTNGTNKTASNLDYPANYTIKHVGTNTTMSNNWVLYSTASASSTVSYGNCTLSDFDSNISSDYTTRTGTIRMNGTSSSNNKCKINFTFQCATGKSDCTASGDSSCTSGSGTLKLSSSAPSGCTYTYESSSSRTITTSGITVSGGNVKVACTGYYAPTITGGSCCSFTGCSGSTTQNCSLSIGSGSNCTISAESCSSGWVGKAGGCCYSDNSQNCCEAPTQSSAGASHTQGTYVSSSSTCCTSANQSSECCKAINGSSYTYSALNKTCKKSGVGDLDTSGSSPVTTVSFNIANSLHTVGASSASLEQATQTNLSTMPKYKVNPNTTGSITLTSADATIVSVDTSNCTGLTISSKTGLNSQTVTLNVSGTCTSNFGCDCELTINTRDLDVN